jgi:hypothetical protein
MKRTLIIAACIFFSLNSLTAQSNKEDIEIIQNAFGKDKKELVSVYMQVAAKDSVAFWKLYDEYEDKRKALGKEKIDIIQQYADNYDNLTDAKATQLAEATLANDAKYTQLYQTYFKKFSAITGGRNAAKLFQLETYLQTLVKAKVMTEIPFVDQLDKTKVQTQ